MAGTDYDRAIGRRIRQIRERNGWSLEDVCERIRSVTVTPSQLSKYERGTQQFKAVWLYRFADALQCPVIDLLTDLSESPEFGQELAIQISELAEPDRDAVIRFIRAMRPAHAKAG